MKRRNLWLTGLIFCVLSTMALVQITVPAGYEVGSLHISSTIAEGPALAVHPTEENLLYASFGAWGPHIVVKIVLASDVATTSVFASGAYNLSGPDDEDDALDSWFGTVGGLAVLHNGEVVIIDNNEQPGVPGDTIYLARDLNSDGDAQDIVTLDGGTTVAEVIELIEPIDTLPGTGWGGFTGQQAVVDTSDTLYIITADGGGQGEVLRVTDLLTTPAINIFFSGLDYGAGLDFDSNGYLYAGSSSWPNPAEIYKMKDLSLPPDGDAVDFGESDLLSTGVLTGIYDLTLDRDDNIFITNGNEVQTVDDITGLPQTFAEFPSWYFLGDIAFAYKSRSFQPYSGPDAALLIIADGDFDGKLTVIKPSEATRVKFWEMYETGN